MFAIVQHGQVTQIVQPHTAFKIGDKPFSNRYLVNATKEERLAEGIYEIIEGERADERFYWVSPAAYAVDGDVVKTSYAATPKDLEDLKRTAVAQINQTANSMLSQTDWMVIRKFERGVAIPDDVAQFRAGVIAEANRAADEVQAAQTVEDLMQCEAKWPQVSEA